MPQGTRGNAGGSPGIAPRAEGRWTHLTSKGGPHGEIVVIHSEKWLRFSMSDFGHIGVLLIQVTAKTGKKRFPSAHRGVV